MEQKETKEKQEVSWNISKIHSYHIAEILRRGAAYQLQGNYPERFMAFLTIRELINYGLSEQEIKDLDKLQNEATSLSNTWIDWKENDALDIDIEKKMEEKRLRFQTLVRDYQRRIMDCLRDLGFFPTKPDKRFVKTS